MPASSTQYGTTLPSGSDPYPIESVLAKIVGENNPAEAANMLDVYQTQRAADTGNYNYALDQQHDFAQEQLRQQLKEQYLKSAMDAVQHRGGLSVFNQMVGPGNAIDPGLTGSIEGGLTNLQNATVAKDVGTAAYQGLEGGLATDAGLAGSMTGGLFSGSTVPLALQKEAMAQAGKTGRANASGGMLSVPVKAGVTDDGQLLTGTVKVPKNATDEQVAAIANNTRRIYGGFYPPGSGIPGMTGPNAAGPTTPGTTQAAPSATAPPPRSRTSLQNNPAAPSAGASGGNAPQPASGTIITDPRTQGAARVAIQHLSPAAKMDVGANIQGATVPIIPLKGGGVGFVGKSGQVHVLPPPGSN